MVAPAEKASLMDSQFDSKQCREQFVTRLSCFPQSRCISLVFRTPVLLRLLLDLDTYCGVDLFGVFPLFLKMVADIIAPKLCIIFPGLIRWGSFLECCLSANVTAILKAVSSPNRENYRPISTTTFLSKVYEKLVSHKLSSFSEIYVFAYCSVCLYRKVWAERIHC